MASRAPLPRLAVVRLALAVVLVAEVAALVVAPRIAAAGWEGDAPVTDRVSAAVRSGIGTVGWSAADGRETGRVAGGRTPAAGAVTQASTSARRTPPSIGHVAPNRPVLAATPVATTTVAPVASRFRGRDHVWIPSLGINRAVAAFPCSRSRPPDNLVYRWGCAGSNNVYLMAHSYGMFKPLHDAYVSGRLAKGMKVYYAGSDGRVRTFSVAWWKTARPTTSASWAWAAQSRSSMTLQTCVGSNSQYRLFVRLVETG